ncbi:hypothetical protein Tco_0756243, partial [Tanacetum coccineum]
KKLKPLAEVLQEFDLPPVGTCKSMIGKVIVGEAKTNKRYISGEAKASKRYILNLLVHEEIGCDALGE